MKDGVVVIRAAGRADAPAVLDLRRRVGAEGLWIATEVPRESLAEQAEFLEAMQDAGRGLFLVAERAGRILGSLGLHRPPAPHSRHVADLGMLVALEERGRGVGRALMREALAWAPRNGVVKITLGVFPENARAIALYERAGFVREGLRRGQYQLSAGPRDEILMAWFAPAGDRGAAQPTLTRSGGS